MFSFKKEGRKAVRKKEKTKVKKWNIVSLWSVVQVNACPVYRLAVWLDLWTILYLSFSSLYFLSLFLYV